jgi:tetratricopeptide (TPR) repeat protein
MNKRETIEKRVTSLSFHKERDKRACPPSGVMRCFLLVFFCLLITSHYSLLRAQRHDIDSLLSRIKTDKQDTTKANDFRGLAWAYRTTGEIKKAMDFSDSSIALAGKLNFKVGLGRFYNTRASIYYIQGDYPNALNYLLKSVEIDEALNDKGRIAANMDDIGLIYKQQGDLKKALECYDKALIADEDLKDDFAIASVLDNMGAVLELLHDTTGAMECFQRILKIKKAVEDKATMAITMPNIGNIYFDEKDYAKALQYYQDGLKLDEELDDKSASAVAYLNIGYVYLTEKKYKDAETYTQKCLEIAKSIGDLERIKNAEDNLGDIYSNTGEWEKALEARKQGSYMKDSLINQAKSKQIGKLEAKAQYDKDLALQKAEEDKKTALSAAESKRQKVLILFVAAIALAIAFIAFIIARSLRTARSQKALIEIQTEEVEKQKTVVEEKNQEIMDSINYAKRLQEAILPPLNDIKKFFPESFIIYKPKDIVSGDFYWLAQGMPQPNLPLEGKVQGMGFNESTPQGGDLGGAKIFLAAADCTGHGVPGALVSVVCSNALNRAVKEFGITEPGKILDKVRELVLETFEKSPGDVQDGMDISLCALEMLPQTPKGALKKTEGVTGSEVAPTSNAATTDASLLLGREGVRVDQPQIRLGQTLKKTEGVTGSEVAPTSAAAATDASLLLGREGARPTYGAVRLTWAGANNPLWIVKKSELESESGWMELPPDKQPIGRFDRVKPFTTHTVNLRKGDCIYLFTDGYADQFGGAKGKKFKYKQLQEILLANSDKPMAEQGKILEKTFEKWMGFLDQIDDVLVIGIKV